MKKKGMKRMSRDAQNHSTTLMTGCFQHLQNPKDDYKVLKVANYDDLTRKMSKFEIESNAEGGETKRLRSEKKICSMQHPFQSFFSARLTLKRYGSLSSDCFQAPNNCQCE